MPTSRAALIVVQLIGALSLIPYPAILLANIMSMAAEGPRGPQRLLLILGFGLLSLYPLVWIALFAFSWRAIGRGAPGRAFAYSAVPLAGTLAGIGVLFANTFSVRQIQSAEVISQQALVLKANPLIWTLICAEGANRLPTAPRVSIDAALHAVQTSDRLNDPAPGYGTPLLTALRNLKYNFDGSPYDRYQPGLERLVRALLARGATLSPSESENLQNAWLLRRATFHGPIDPRAQNPLIYRVLQMVDQRGPYMRDGTVPSVGPEDAALLNKPAPPFGTPLCTALRLGGGGGSRMIEKLIYAGAHLSPEELADPAVVAALRHLFEERPDLRTVYQR